MVVAVVVVGYRYTYTTHSNYLGGVVVMVVVVVVLWYRYIYTTHTHTHN